ncbi:actin nucleation-promoting factor WASL-like [Culicoides brevitarsis]|uniref:actin nucleation-promoting factor WASL-like n=1 Tax=Culicoides brevitarsis TaxID=469753 RepID=UPI00307C31A2
MSLQPRENRSSKLLSIEENTLVFSLLGERRISQCTTVVQLFVANPPSFSRWTFLSMGVLCFVKDGIKRSYFLRLYCIKRRQAIWEQEIYNEFTFTQPRRYLIVFESDASIVCLNFASDDESTKLGILLQKYLENRREKLANRSTAKSSVFVDQKVVKEIPEVIVGKKEAKKAKRKISKADIGNPTNFVHVESGSRDNRLKILLGGKVEHNEIPLQRLSKFLDTAGVTPRMLDNRKTRDAVQSFIEENQLLLKISRPAPTIPTIPPPIPEDPPNLAPITKTQNILAPPPPPPPPLMPNLLEAPMMPTIQEKPSNLLSEIEKGIKLTKVEPVQRDGGRNDLLQDIQRGFDLKPAKDRQRKISPIPLDESSDLANAMKKALDVILTANYNSDSDDEEIYESFDKWNDE